MIPSVYIIGGAGSGKSTFMAELTSGLSFDPMVDLYALPNRKAVVTLRGHPVAFGPYGPRGLYLGCMRDWFPGTDGLDRASSPVGAAWLSHPEKLAEYDFIVSEGATLATRRFLGALGEATELLLVHLHVEPFISELRFLQRGSKQDPGFVQATETRSANLLRDLSGKVWVRSVDSGDPAAWAETMELCRDHLSFP